MPCIIVKPEPDQDFYVLWSTITDGPTGRGTRAELKEYIRTFRPDPSEADDDRFNRADNLGSSATGGYVFGHWNSAGFIVYWDAEGENEIGPRWLPRSNLGVWLHTGDESYTEPIED